MQSAIRLSLFAFLAVVIPAGYHGRARAFPHVRLHVDPRADLPVLLGLFVRAVAGIDLLMSAFLAHANHQLMIIFLPLAFP